MKRSIRLFTGMKRGTLEEATAEANDVTKETEVYFTAVKAHPIRSFDIDRVWVITNRFDPDVIK